MGFLAGKRALVLGVASDRSIAWGIAQAMRREGAEAVAMEVSSHALELGRVGGALFDVGVFLTVLGAVLHMLLGLLEREG